MEDPEAYLADRLFCPDFYAGDSGARGVVPAPVERRFDRVRRSLEDGLDAPVREIADPAGQAIVVRSLDWVVIWVNDLMLAGISAPLAGPSGQRARTACQRTHVRQ